MAVPNIVYRPGANGITTDLTSPIGGPIDVTKILDPSGSTDNVFFSAENASSVTDVQYNEIFYISLESATTLAQARVYNRSGSVLNTTTGIPSAVSTSAADTGKILVTGQVGGIWRQDTISLNGTTTVYGSLNFDAGTVYRWEYLNSAGTSSAKPNGNVACFINATQVCLFYGTGNGNSANGVNAACSVCSAEFTLALALAKNTALSAADQLHSPTGVGSYFPATLWSGADNSITVPTTGAMVQNDYIGVAVIWLAKANIFLPVGGRVVPIFSMVARPTS